MIRPLGCSFFLHRGKTLIGIRDPSLGQGSTSSFCPAVSSCAILLMSRRQVGGIDESRLLYQPLSAGDKRQLKEVPNSTSRGIPHGTFAYKGKSHHDFPVHQTGHLRTSHYCCCLKNEVPSMRWKKPHIWCLKWMKVGLVSGSPKHFTQKHGQCQEVALHTFLEPIANFNGDFYLNAAIWVTLILWGGTWSLVTSPSWIFTRIETRKQAEGGIIWQRRGIWGS